MKNIAIIPARSGSKGVKDKNIRELKGKPLLFYSVRAAEESGLFDEIMVSTDSEAYAETAVQYGAKVPFLRSRETASDFSGSWDVVAEVLNGYAARGRRFDTVCLLQPTSPLRTAEDIVNGYRLYRDREADAVTAVCACEHSPKGMMKLGNDLSISEFRKTAKDLPRQLEEQYYRINGALYIRKTEEKDGHFSVRNEREIAYIMPNERSVDIDTELDFAFAEFLMERMNRQR